MKDLSHTPIQIFNAKQFSTVELLQTTNSSPQNHGHILGMRVDITSYEAATNQIIKWAKAKESRYVCTANVHMLMEAYDDPAFSTVMNQADLVTPDGMPLVFTLQALVEEKVNRVCGPDLTLYICQAAAKQGIPIGFYGSDSETLESFATTLRQEFPGINIVCQISPPFRPLTPAEDEVLTQQIIDSKAQILFVGLGCPKQETWMFNHRGRIKASMIGIGAAFNFHSGKVKRAPKWVQNICMEWAYRLIQQPKHLWRRYAKHNLRFLIFLIAELLTLRSVGSKQSETQT